MFRHKYRLLPRASYHSRLSISSARPPSGTATDRSLTPHSSSRSGRRLRSSRMECQLAVRSELAAIALEEHALGWGEGGLLVPRAQPVLGDSAALIIGQRRRKAYHKLGRAVTGQSVAVGGASSLPLAVERPAPRNRVLRAPRQAGPGSHRWVGEAPARPSGQRAGEIPVVRHCPPVPRAARARRRACPTGARPRSRKL